MEYRYRHNNQDYVIQLEPRPNGLYVASIGDRTYEVEVKRSDGAHMTLLLNGERANVYAAACDTCKTGSQLRYVALVDRQVRTFELERLRETGTHRGKTGGEDSLTAQMPGQVRQVLVAEGDRVDSGQALLILEAMKMEIRVSAPHAGTVLHLHVRQGQTVERGQQLAEISAE